VAKFKLRIKTDITNGKELLESGNERDIRLFIETVEAKYSDYISGLNGIVKTESFQISNGKKTWSDVLKKVIDILDTGMDLIATDNYGRPLRIKDSKGSGINISNKNYNKNDNLNDNLNDNTNINKLDIDINILIEETKAKIQEDFEGVISDEDLKNTVAKLDELKEINMSNESSGKKWIKIKQIVSWILTQGVGIFTTVMPVILKMLENK